MQGTHFYSDRETPERDHRGRHVKPGLWRRTCDSLFSEVRPLGTVTLVLCNLIAIVAQAALVLVLLERIPPAAADPRTPLKVETHYIPTPGPTVTVTRTPRPDRHSAGIP